MRNRTMKKANPFFQNAKRIIKPFWIGLMAGSGFLACVSTTTPPATVGQGIRPAPAKQVAVAPVTAQPPAAAPVQPMTETMSTQQATVIERVEDYGQFPQTLAQSTGPINLIPPNDPLLAAARIRGVQWPMVNNSGSSQVYPKMKGLVSFYHEDALVATGEQYNPRAMTAAHKSLPFGTIVRCTRVDTGHSVVVMINDRGPYVRGRVLDLSRSAARELDMISDGVVPCLIEVLAYPLIEAMGPRGNG
nr:similar to rare lipoprotein A [uncultured bacterium]